MPWADVPVWAWAGRQNNAAHVIRVAIVKIRLIIASSRRKSPLGENENDGRRRRGVACIASFGRHHLLASASSSCAYRFPLGSLVAVPISRQLMGSFADRRGGIVAWALTGVLVILNAEVAVDAPSIERYPHVWTIGSIPAREGQWLL